MNIDEALMIASKDKGFSFGELHEAVDILATEVKRLQVWNIRWRDFVKKQREEIQILSSEVTRLHDIEHQLYEAGDGDTWREACGRLEAQIKVLQDEIKQQNKDWCDEDEAVRNHALRVLPKETVYGDTWSVPSVVALSEMMADEIIKLRNNIMKDSFNDLTIDQINTLYDSLCKEDCSKPTPKITVKSLPSKKD